MRLFRLRLAALAALIATFGAGTSSGGFGMRVTPGRIDLQISPGVTSSVPVTVANTSDVPLHVVVTSGEFTIDDSGTYAYAPPSGQGTSLANWLAIRPREFDVAPQSFQQVELSVIVPGRQLSGEYAGVVFFQTRPGRDTLHRGVGVALAERYADKVYATVAGTGTRDGRVERVAADAIGGKERYRVVFRNTGNVHEYLNGRIEVLRSGAVVQTVALPKNTLVERGGERNIEVTGDRLAPAAYDVVAIVDYGAGKTGGKIHLETHT
jgi:hypothetical protein